jgi:hypothetical protein
MNNVSDINEYMKLVNLVQPEKMLICIREVSVPYEFLTGHLFLQFRYFRKFHQVYGLMD